MFCRYCFLYPAFINPTLDALSHLAFFFHCFLILFALFPPECCFQALLISFCTLIKFNLYLYSKSHYFLPLCHSSFSLNFSPRWSSVTQMVRISHPDGASSVSSDEGGVGGVSGSHPGPLIRRQAAAHHQVSGLTDRHPGGRPEPGNRKSGVQPVPTRLLPQGTGVPYHQPAYQGTHLVSESWCSLRLKLRQNKSFLCYQERGMSRLVSIITSLCPVDLTSWPDNYCSDFFCPIKSTALLFSYEQFIHHL